VRKGPLTIEINKRDSTAIRTRAPASMKLAVILAVTRGGTLGLLGLWQTVGSESMPPRTGVEPMLLC